MAYKVLIVDDEPDLRESVSYLLQGVGYEVECAANGHEGIGAAHSFRPHLVLLDVMMPKENGYRVSRRIRDAQVRGLLPMHTKVVLLTARKLDHDPAREKMFEEFAQPDAVIYKPFDPNQLLSVIGQMMQESVRV